MKPYYTLVPSALGRFAVIWREIAASPRVVRILLPREDDRTEDFIRGAYPGASPRSCPAISQLSEKIEGFTRGQALDFELDILALDDCPPFQRSVLQAEHRIPRGWVSTYGRLARRVGVAGGARAVGRALARNPFPIVIPCHRAIRANGELGGFQGGPGMKRALLQMEGVEFSPQGKVTSRQIYY